MDIRAVDFGKSLKRLREERGLSQEGLGRMCGVTHSTISQYETGMILPKVERLEKLATALRVPVSELLGQERSAGTLTYDELVLLANYRKMNDEGKADLRKHAQVMAASGLYAL